MDIDEKRIEVLDAFFLRFFIDGASIYSKLDIDAVVQGCSDKISPKLSQVIIETLKKWEAEGRLILNDKSDSEYIKLDKTYWGKRIEMS